MRNQKKLRLLMGALTLGLTVSALALNSQASSTGKRFVALLSDEASRPSSARLPFAWPAPGSSTRLGALTFRRSIMAESAFTSFSQRTSLPAGLTNPLANILIVTSTDSTISEDDIRAALGSGNVIYVEEDRLLELHDTPPETPTDIPTDPLFADQWGLLNSGQEYFAVERLSGVANDTLKRVAGQEGEDIALRNYYALRPAPVKRPIIGLIDTGVDDDHVEMLGQIWQNQDEIAGNGVDDDHNGLIDDDHGYDFSGDSLGVFVTYPDNDPSDQIGHGTHLAGIIAAAENGIGVVGVCPQARIMPIKIFPNAFMSVAVEGIVYAVTNGADIINISWGSPFRSQLVEKALLWARANGVMVVASAGNGGNNVPQWPAAFDSVFTVGAVNSDGEVTSFSSIGPHLDLVAPGKDILSLRAEGTDMFAEGGEPGVHIIDSIYYLSDGTSMAAPMVTGAAALLLSLHPELTPAELENILRQSARDVIDPYHDGWTLPGVDSVSGWGFVDVGAALAALEQPALTFVGPDNFSRQTTSFPLLIAPHNGYQGGWWLEYTAAFDTSTLNILAQGAQAPADSVAFVYTDTLRSGLVKFRLTDDSGNVSQLQIQVAGEPVARIIAPISGDTLRRAVQITGRVYAETYDSLQLISRSADGELNTLLSSTAEYYDEVIYTWSLGALLAGDYTILLRVFTASGELNDSSKVTVVSLLRAGWPRKLTFSTGFAPTVADLDNDGLKEIIVGSFSGLWVFEHDGETRTGFPSSQLYDCRSAPAVYDIDHDGFLDILFASDQGLHVIDRFGNELAGWPQTTPTGQVFFGFPTVTVGKLGADRDSAIILVNAAGQVRAYDFAGDPYFYSLSGLFTRIDPNLTNDFSFRGLSMPQVVSFDENQDGRSELIAAYSSPGATSGVFLFNGRDGQPANGRASARSLEARETHGMACGDIDNDGNLEALLSGLNSAGEATLWLRHIGEDDLPGWPIVLPGLADWIGNYPTLADITGDDIPEIIATFFEFDVAKVFAFTLDGSPLSELPDRIPGEIVTFDRTLSGATVADVDGDGVGEIICRSGYIFPGTGFEEIYAFELDGSIVAGFPLQTAAAVNVVTSTSFMPQVVDIDGDGLLEMVLLGSGNWLNVWNLGVPASDHRWDWPRFLHDELNTGIGGTPPSAQTNLATKRERQE